MPRKSSREFKDRRSINLSYGLERRQGAVDRRGCPECGGVVATSMRKVATGTVTTLYCTRCHWKAGSEQVDAKVLMAKLTWAMEMEKRGADLLVRMPRELVEALDLKPKDELVLEPLTLPVGSLEMQWRLTLNKKKA